MAESFYRAGVNCDVAAIQSAGGDTWKAFCDCMFAPGSADWTKCVARACLLAWGCPNPSKGGALDPFNVHPAMLAAPWTDGGAAARGIPKRDASVANSLIALTTVNAAEYTPLGLWQTYWLNPAKYAVLMAQLSLFVPVIGAYIVQIINSVGPLAPPFPLIPFALPEIAAKGLKVETAILEPAFKGSIKNIGTVLQYLGNCGIGANIPCGAGLAVKRAAQDQIDTGEINKVQDQTTRAIIVFLSKSGDTLTEAVMKSVTGAMNNGVFAALEAGFLSAEQFVRNSDPGAAAALLILGKAAGVGAVIASGIAQKRDAALIADDISDKLLGFRPSVYFQLIKTSAATATAYVRAAQSTQGTGFEKAQNIIAAVSEGLSTMADVINKLSAAIGGGLSGLAGTFVQAANAVSGSSQAAIAAQQQILAQAASSGGFIPTWGAPKTTLATSAPPRIVAASTSTPAGAKPMSAIPYFVGGAAGALLGGPIGGAVGVGAGALVARLMSGSAPSDQPYMMVVKPKGQATSASNPKVDPQKVLNVISKSGSLFNGFGGVAYLRSGESQRLTATSAQGPAQMLTVVGRNGPVRVDARSYAAQRGFAPIAGTQQRPAARRFPDVVAHARGYGFIGTKTSSFLTPLPPPAPFTVMKSVPATKDGPAALKMALVLAQQNMPAASTNSTVNAGVLTGVVKGKGAAAQDEAAISAAKAAAAKAAEQAALEAAWKRMNTTTATPNVSRELPPTTPEEAPPVMPAFPGTNESAPPNGVPQYLPRVGMSGATIAIGVGAIGLAAYFLTRKKTGSTS